MKYNAIYPALISTLLLTSCADEDFAMLGAVATGAAANYASANGNSATAASLLDTQHQIINEEANTAAANASLATNTVTHVAASPVPGKPGFAISPHSGKAVNVEGISAGTLVEDPTFTNGRFRVPASAASSQQMKSSSSGGSGITGTWTNSKLTWILNADGTGQLIIPSTNGTNTNYMKWSADASSGMFNYTLTRSTLTGTLNCTGDSDHEITTNKSYYEKYSLSGNSLTIGTEVMTR